MASERITIIVEEKGSRIVSRNLRDIGGAAAAGASGVQLLRSMLLTLGVGATLASTIHTISQFEQSISNLRAVSASTESDINRLREASKRLGVDTVFSAAQVAEGFVVMTRAGFSVEEQLRTMRDVADLAAAGHMELSTATQATTMTLRSFRMSMDQASRVADVFARVANMTTTDVGQLSQAMKFVGPAAAGLNVTLEETAAAMSTIMETGLGARQAGSGLRTIMSELETPTGRVRQTLRSMGIELNSVKISQTGLAKALQVLKSAGVGTADAMTMFGDANGQVLDTLLKMLPELEKYNTSLKSNEGFASRTARILKDNLGGALADVKSSIEAVMISFGEMGSSALLTKIVRGLANAILFLSNHVEILDGVLIGLAAVSLPRVIQMMGLLLKLVASNWVVALAAGIGALVAFRDEIKLSADSTTTLADFGSAAFERIKTSGQLMIDFLRDQFGGLTDIFDGISFSLKDMILLTARGLDAWIGIWRGAMVAVGGLLMNLGPALKEIAINIVNDLIKIADSGLRKFYGLLGKIPGRVGEPYRRLAEGVIPQIENVAEGASARLGQAVVNGFAAGFDQITVFEDSVNGLLDRADQIAKERLQRQQTQATGAGLPTTPTGAGVAPTPEDLPQTMNQFETGVANGMEKISQTIFFYGSQVEATLTNAFSSAEDALVSFVTTGKVDFKGMVASMLADLTRLLARMALMKLMEGFGAKAPPIPVGGRANGGPVEPGKSYWVGEKRRPEIFTPSVPGQITPMSPAASVPMKAQEPPKVTIIQVNSMDEALAAMRSTEGQRIIMSTRGG